LAARTHTYAQPRRSGFHATLAVISGLAAVLAIPVAIELTRKMHGAVLLDAAWGIPVAAVAAVASLSFERAARGSRTLMTARVLAVTGICLTLSSALAVGIYEVLLWRERH
jgi:hypothetical protein